MNFLQFFEPNAPKKTKSQKHRSPLDPLGGKLDLNLLSKITYDPPLDDSTLNVTKSKRLAKIRNRQMRDHVRGVKYGTRPGVNGLEQNLARNQHRDVFGREIE